MKVLLLANIETPDMLCYVFLNKYFLLMPGPHRVKLPLKPINLTDYIRNIYQN